jgi:hypothetical protein
VQVKPHHKKEMKKIIGELNCPKDFVCYKSGFSNLCEAEDIGLEPFLQCLEKSREECPFLVSYANVHFCDCPLRVYIAKKLKR